MLALGFWQLSRAAEKIQWQEAADLALQQAPVTLAELPSPRLNQRYARVSLVGRFEAGRQFLWDNRIQGGLAGYEVITPFRLADGQLVLVNRGWVRADPRREILPDIQFSNAENVTVTGIMTQPSIGFSSGPAVDPNAKEWPKRLQHFASDEIEEALAESVFAGLVQNLSSHTPLPVPMYNNNWVPVASGPERHYGYAFQWFAMFVALTFLFIYLNLSRNRST